MKAASAIIIVELIVFFSPFIFQLAFGLRALRRKVRLKFWAVCLISIISQILATVYIVWTLGSHLKKEGIHDGLGLMAFEFMGVFLIALILLISIIQLVVHSKTKKTATNTTR